MVDDNGATRATAAILFVDDFPFPGSDGPGGGMFLLINEGVEFDIQLTLG
jgi:hypothetical protein